MIQMTLKSSKKTGTVETAGFLAFVMLSAYCDGGGNDGGGIKEKKRIGMEIIEEKINDEK